MKLMTKALEKLLEKNPLYSHEDDAMEDVKVLAKFFCGPATWYVTEGSFEYDDYVFFGLVHIMDNEPELGYFSLSEIEDLKVGPFGLTAERDMYFEPCKHTLKEALEAERSGRCL